jgi:uncharacterized protein (UPF0210 family)
LRIAQPALETAGYEIQTTRLATVPFPTLPVVWDPDEAIKLAQELENAAREEGFDFVSLGPALPEIPGSYTVIPDLLAATDDVFVSAHIATHEHGVSLPAVQACGEIIEKASVLDPNGFGNLYFAALANVPPGGPFFPAAYHDDGPPTFALAVESADLAVTAFAEAGNLPEAQKGLTAAINEHSRTLTRVSQELAVESELVFGGIDFSLAPFPTKASSIGTALEKLGLQAVGKHGSLAAAAFMTNAIDRAVFPRAGFNGLFMPLLEDSTLAERAAQDSLSLKDLLLYAAVCGTGLDTIPLPGDTTAGQIAPVLLDLAALALRLDKPLTARLMPVPGKAAGEETAFNFEYFANSKVLRLESAPLEGLFDSGHSMDISPRG